MTRKILLISEYGTKPEKIYLDPVPKLAKGLIRLGHDARVLWYADIMAQLSPVRGRSLTHRFFKQKADRLIVQYARQYQPDAVIMLFARALNSATVQALRDALPKAVFLGWDGDLWPARKPGRIELGCALDIVLATNNGIYLDQYRQAGARTCLFMPNLIDPDIDRRYQVEARHRCNILWTGKGNHKSGSGLDDSFRHEVLSQIVDRSDAKIFGCFDRPAIEGIEYRHAISGARIGISINAENSIPLYHSDRFTHYSAGGTMVLAKRVPESNLLMEDGRHVRYFDSGEECLDLVDWYLKHEQDRQEIADAGMMHCHHTFNSVKIAGCIMDVIERGSYVAPWGSFS